MKKWILAILALLALVAGGLGVCLLVPPKPEYCWLVFGPEAKSRVLVCLRGNKVSIERKEDGEFSGAGERLGTASGYRGYFAFDDVVITDPGEQTTYTITGMTRFDNPGPPHLSAHVYIRGSLEYRQYCDVELTSNPHDAKEAHFHGPLTVDLSPKAPWTLQRGDKPTRLRVSIGTMYAEKGCWVVVCTESAPCTPGGKMQPAFPKGLHPVVDVEFPAAHEGAVPIKRRCPLDEPC